MYTVDFYGLMEFASVDKAAPYVAGVDNAGEKNAMMAWA